MILREWQAKDLKRTLALNEASVHFLSPLTQQTLMDLLDACDFKYVVEVEGSVEAFVLALSDHKPYESVNYQWFMKNYEHFLYIDRIVVSNDHQSKGIGSLIYQRMIKKAKENTYPFLLAEIDLEPENPKSLSFHKKFTFKEVGRQSINDGKKLVSLQVLEL